MNSEPPTSQGAAAPRVREIYLAGGCFWGVSAFLKRLPGVASCAVGYANGLPEVENPSYEEVCSGRTRCAETVRAEYDPRTLPLPLLLEGFLSIIDPTSLNRQGGDVGTQYRTGIYWTDPADEQPVRDALYRLQRRLFAEGRGRVAVEALPLSSFWPAEEYHQDYLDKNPGGYCHVDLGAAERFVASHERDFQIAAAGYERPDDEAIERDLDPLAFEVTQHAATERPWSSELDGQFRRGIYVDRVTGQPLFASADKFESGCGWPAFARPIAESALVERADATIPGRPRVEVRSSVGGSHLGHVFEDGPEELGGLRYCINGAALEFVPLEDMDARGYGYLKGVAE